MAYDSVGRSLQTELYMLPFLPVYVQISVGLHVLKLYAVYGSYNTCHVSTRRGTQIVNPAFPPAILLQWQIEASAAIALIEDNYVQLVDSGG